jgi:hypothetical protein
MLRAFPLLKLGDAHMGWRSPRVVGALLVAALHVAGQQQLKACGFDAPLGNSFSAMHPRSIAVAFAIRDAVDDKMVAKSVLDPIVPGAAGYWRAVRHLIRLQGRLSEANESALAKSISISVLFIDSNLWSRFNPSQQGWGVQVHTTGAQPRDVVMVTSESILASVLDGRLPIEAALDRGLIAIDGAAADAAAAIRILAAALTSPPASSLHAGTSVVQSVRFFGPSRIGTSGR